MSNITFSQSAFEQYTEWQTQDKKTLKRINALLKDIQRSGSALDGIGKPEKLRHRPGYSRRIDEQNRLVYDFDEDGTILVIAVKGHYEDE